jgi:3-isopropylmalate dehydrogenase
MPGLNARAERAMAQAAHGSAPDIAGEGIANPVAEILSGALLLDWLGRRHRDEGAVRAAARIEAAVRNVLAEGRIRTPDIGGTATTAELGQAVAERVRTVSGTELTG